MTWADFAHQHLGVAVLSYLGLLATVLLMVIVAANARGGRD